MVEWKDIAKARGWDIEDSVLEQIAPVLTETSELFDRLVAERLPLETEPACLYRLAPADFD